MTERKRRVRAWIIGGAVFAAAMSMCGCSSVRSMIGLSDGSEQSTQPHFAAPTEPVTSVASGETSREAALESAPAEANRPATIGDGNKSPNQLAYSSGSVTTGDTSASSSTPVNQFGEIDGRPMPNVAGGSSAASVQQHTAASEGADSDVSVDPSGRWLAFVSTRHCAHPQMYLQRAEGTSVVQLTNDSADYAFPSFSSDGQRITFCSNRAGDWDIYVMDIDGRNCMQLTSGACQDLHPSFSPDGKRIVFCSLPPRANQWEIWTINLTTNEKRMISYGLFPSWSPNKSKDQIAFQRARQRGSRWFSLWTLDVVDGEARSITEVAASSNAAIVSPSWSPDGLKLAFATVVDPSTLSDPSKAPQDIWMVNADGSNRRRMTDGNGANCTPAWSSDNRIYFVSNRAGSDCVWSARAETSGEAPEAPVANTDTKEATH